MRELSNVLWFAAKWLVGLTCVLTLSAFILFPWYARVREWETAPSCQTNLRSISFALKQYLQDNEAYYPQASSSNININPRNPFGWADSLEPYIKDQSVFWCQKLNETRSRNFNGRVPNATDYTDYWFNRRMLGTKASSLNHSATTIILGDGNDGTDATNARYSLRALPSAWKTDVKSPAYRHVEGANYAFADGHIKWLKANKVTTQKPNGEIFTFAIK